MKAEYKTLDWIFKHEEKLKEAVEKIKCQEISMFNNSHLRDPTAANALRTLVMVNSVKIERKHINSPDKWLEIISNTYEIAKSKNANICEIAERRYHMGEYSTTTRFEKCLSKKNYWQMISIFLGIARRISDQIFKSEKDGESNEARQTNKHISRK